MVMFTSPSRALACAVAIQQGIERHNHRADEPLAVRIGLSMGEATEEDGDYYGDHVTETLALVREHGFDGLRPRAEALLAHLDA